MKREIRSSSITGVAGVGAIIDVGQESFLIPGLNRWRQSDLRLVELRRLSSRLGKVLKTPKEHNPSLQVKRFPAVLFCEKCRHMVFWKTDMEREDSEPVCTLNNCGGKLLPMRFVATCEKGHLSDVDWQYWAHSGPHGSRACRSRDKLYFVVSRDSTTGGLASLRVECREPGCNSFRTLEDLANRQIVKQIFQKCPGRHPWLYNYQEDCDADVVILQRGATNLHYPKIISALDIPDNIVESPASQFAGQIRDHQKYPRLVNMISDMSGDTGDMIDLMSELIADAIGCDKSTVVEVARAESEGNPVCDTASCSAKNPVEQDELLEEEWKTLEAAIESGKLSGPHFEAEQEEIASDTPKWIKCLLNGILLIRRLREVRVYQGFQRVIPGLPEKMVLPDIGIPEPWLPASEIYGEGIVFSFNFEILEQWSLSLPDEEQLALQRLEKKRIDENFWFLPKADPVLLAVHTLSHLLIRQLTFECGYSSSSLRERLYFNRESRFASLMIYTADGDSEGSLGGLVRQGRKDRIASTISNARAQGAWCSSDPVCFETAGQGLGGFNRAACHACSLISETSCIFSNTLLDRRMLFEASWGLLPFLDKKS